MGLYAASKHALEGASEALYYELRPWGIHVTLVEPGFVASEAYMNVRLGLAYDRQSNPTAEHYKMQTRMVSSLVERAIRFATSTPDEVAAEIAYVLSLRRPPLRRQVTLDAQIFAFLKRFLPATFFDRLIGACLDRIRHQLEHEEFESPSPAQI
jgi:hypothetical protein